MKTYIGTKIVKAEPSTVRRTNSVGEEIEKKEGYTVIYEDGYESWSPKDVFERCYREITEKEKALIGGEDG